MVSRQEIEQKLKNLKPILYQKYHVSKIGYFGSYAEGSANESSDIDILIDFDQPVGWEFFDIQDILSSSLQKKIDLVSLKALKKQLKEKILKQVIYI